MGLLDVYADGIEKAFQRDLRNPGPAPQADSFSAWSFLAAGSKGIPSAGLETAASGSDLLSGFGTALAATGGSSEGMFSTGTAAEKQQAEQASKRLREGDAFDTRQGNELRRRADEFAPDPETAHTADKVIHGLVRGVGKAVAETATLGPVAGPVAFGLDEGNNAAQRLRMQGIDTATAAKVGGVTGVIAAATAGIPGAGPTIAKTVGLTLATGPAAYIAQEKLTRDILQKADYGDLAAQHDPYDPLGLALSTILPAAVGGMHVRGLAKRAEAVKTGGVPLEQMTPAERGALKFNDPRLDAFAEQAAAAHDVPASILLGIKNAGEKSNSDQTSPAGAKGVMQFMPATAKEMGITDPTDPMQSIDGAARYMRKLYDAYGSWDAAVAHYNGGGAQAAIVRGGGKPTIPETAAYLERVRAYAQDHMSSRGAADPATVDAARVALTDEALMRSMPEHPDARSEALQAADELAAGRLPNVLPPLELFHGTPDQSVTVEGLSKSLDLGPHFTTARETAQLFAGEVGRVLEARGAFQKPLDLPDLNSWFPTEVAKAIDESAGIKAGADEMTPLQAKVWSAMEKAKQEHLDAQPAEYQRLRNDFSKKPPEVMAMMKDVLNAASEKANAVGYQMLREHLAAQGVDAIRYKNMNEGASVDTYIALDRSKVSSADRAPTVASSSDGRNSLPESNSVTMEPAKAEPAKTEVKSLDAQRVTQLAAENPDMRVRLPGSDETVTLETAMKQAKEEAAYEASEADLVKAAFECALSIGA